MLEFATLRYIRSPWGWFKMRIWHHLQVWKVRPFWKQSPVQNYESYCVLLPKRIKISTFLAYRCKPLLRNASNSVWISVHFTKISYLYSCKWKKNLVFVSNSDFHWFWRQKYLVIFGQNLECPIVVVRNRSPSKCFWPNADRKEKFSNGIWQGDARLDF